MGTKRHRAVLSPYLRELEGSNGLGQPWGVTGLPRGLALVPCHQILLSDVVDANPGLQHSLDPALGLHALLQHE